MPLVRDTCICLRRTEYSESSQILTLLGREHGIVRLIAKGAHRRTKAGATKFDGGIDLLDVGDAVFSHAPERDLSPLCEWTLRDGHLELRKDLRAIHLGLYAAELIGMLVEEHDPHAQLFDRTVQALDELGTARREESFLALILDLLRETGYLPELVSCVICGGSASVGDRAYFSAARGGAVCRNCEGTAPDRASIDVRLLRLIGAILALPRSNGSPQRLPRLTQNQTDPINDLLTRHIEHTLSRRLRMPAYVLKSH